MRRLIILWTIFSSVSISGADFSTDTVSICSKILSESRTIYIYRPTGLKCTDAVSVIYLPYGEFSRNIFEKIVNENITNIVGIGIVIPDRRRDLLPINQADKFLDFIDKELIPRIDSICKTSQRILYGHSFGGGFTIYAMINKPGLFNKYIASSPTPIMKMIDPSIYVQLNSKLEKDIKFYFSYGSRDMKQVRKWGEKLYNNLLTIKLSRIEWKNEIYDGENHNTCGLISLLKGLKY